MGIKDRLPGRRPGAGSGTATDESENGSDGGSGKGAGKGAGSTRAGKPERAARTGAGIGVWRTRASQLLWTVCVLLALVLAIGALLVAIDANESNGLVDFVMSSADAVDLGVFSRENGIREFGGDNAETKNALFNWGLGAVAYLVLGRVLERLVRPGS